MDILEVKNLWSDIKDVLKETLPAPAFQMWLDALEPVDYDGNVFFLCSVHALAPQVIKANYDSQILEALKKVLGKSVSYQITFDAELADKYQKEKKKELQKAKRALPETEESKIIDNLAQMQSSANLNLKYKFANFVVGENSRFAHAAAFAVAQNPAKKYNPLFIYGASGLGKTHLMQAIGNRILENGEEKLKICYIQAESFLNDFTQSLLNKNSDKFKNKYRNLDVLLLDDIHFLQNKTGIQEELFYTFEALHKKNAQMVFTCDRPLREIQNMAERLVSRLGSGMCIDLLPPNYENRRAILLKKLETKNKSLPMEIVDFIAQTVETNVRDLGAALDKVLGYAEFIDNNMTLEIAQSLLSDLYSSPAIGNISIENILKVVADNYQISVSDLKGKKRDKKYSFPRFIATYIAREITEYSFTEIGNELGGRDHSSIMHAYEKINERIQTDSSFKSKIKVMIDEIKKFKN